MIQFADDKTAPIVRHMWQTVFGDSDEYVDFYFSNKFREENTLIYLVDGAPAASLQMWEYKLSFHDQKIPIYYLAGLCTYKEHRRKGYMEQLIAESHNVMKSRNIPMSILIPAEDWLYDFYARYGYTQVFEENDEPIILKKLLDKAQSIEEAFVEFDRIYNKTSFTVLKNLEDFKAIAQENKIEEYSVKTNLDGVARVIDVQRLLQIYAQNNISKRFTVKVTGDTHITSNNTYYTVEDGTVSIFDRVNCDFEMDIRELCQSLMGYKTDEIDHSHPELFPLHNPIMNLMLE